jgi:hypothetical protein
MITRDRDDHFQPIREHERSTEAEVIDPRPRPLVERGDRRLDRRLAHREVLTPPLQHARHEVGRALPAPNDSTSCRIAERGSMPSPQGGRRRRDATSTICRRPEPPFNASAFRRRAHGPVEQHDAAQSASRQVIVS